MDTNVLIITVLSIFIYPNNCFAIEKNRLCNCDKVECRLSPVKVSRVCRAFKGSFEDKSLDSSDCNCCAKCVIKKSFGQSCLFSGVNEIVVKCEKHLYCDSRNGFICLKKSSQNIHKFFNELNARNGHNITVRIPRRRASDHWIPKAVLQSLHISEYNQMMDKTRFKRSPIKIGFGGANDGKKKKKMKAKVPLDEAPEDNTKLRAEAPDEADMEEQPQQQPQQPQQQPQPEQQQSSGSAFTDEESKKCANCESDDCRRECRRLISKQVKMIKGGHSNSINQNSGPTFIVNNNYYGFRGGKLTKLKSLPKGSHAIDVKMDKEPIAKANSEADAADQQNNAADAEKGDDYPTEKPRIRKPKPKRKPKIEDDSDIPVTESPEVTTTTPETVTKKKKLKKIVEPETDESLGQPVDRSNVDDDSESVTVTIATKPTKSNKRIFYRRMEKTIQEDEGFEGENSERPSTRTKTKKTKPAVSDTGSSGGGSDAYSESSEGIVKTPRKPAKPASSGKSKTKHKVTVITEQRFGEDGQRTRTTYIYDGDEWVIVDINGEISDGYPSKEDLKLLNEKVVNPQKNDKAVVNIEEVAQ